MKTSSIFVYGTLQSQRVVETLLAQRPLLQRIAFLKPAKLYGHSRSKVKDHVFPAMIASTDSSHVTGCVITGLSPTEVRIFDWFESEEYERCDVQAIVETEGSDSMTHDVQTYVWKQKYFNQLDLDQPWSLEEFETSHLEWYLKSTVEPCRKEVERLVLDK